MAWALITDGVNDRCSLTKVTIPSGEDFTIRFIWKFTAEVRGFQLGEVGAFNNGLSLWYRAQPVFNQPSKYFGVIECSTLSTEFEYSTLPVLDTWYDWEVRRTSGTVDIVDTATQVSVLLSTVTNNNAFAFDSFFKWGNTSNFFTGQTQLIQLTSVSNNHTWDATASDHSNTGSQPVLVDTIGSNNATGVNMPTDGSAWVDLGGGAAEQEITTSTTEQLSQAQTVNISEFNEINAIICQQDSSAQLSNLTLDNQVSTITTEQATHCSLSAIATINTLTAINAEQLTQSGSIDNSATQLIYAVQAQQLSQALTVSITSNGAQDINVVITEQLTHVQTISAEESQQLQAIITQQITQSINTDIEQQLALTAITAEQLTQAVTVTINESSGIFVSVVQTEQLTQAISANIDVTEIISTVITEQLSQYSAQQVSIDLTVSAVIAEQLTQAELINVVLQNISNQLNIDMDQISIEMLTPTYEIEMLTPTYTIEHIQ